MTRTALLRPTLLPGLARVWRDPHTLQLGLDPARAVLLDLPDPRAARILDLLDGRRPERAVLAEAAAGGLTVADTLTVIDTLHAAGLVLAGPQLIPATLPDAARRRLSGEATALALERSASPTRTTQTTPTQTTPTQATPTQATPTEAATPAQILRGRMAARVVITGFGRLAAPIAVALAEAGVGHLDPDVPGAVDPAELSGSPLRQADLGRPRAEAIAAAVRAAAPETETHSVRRGRATLVVQLGHEQPVALLAAAHAARRQAHLAVQIREASVVVGPLVPATGGPCLNCLDLHRKDRDAGWPTPGGTTGQPEPCAVTTLLAATALATGEALEFLDGGSPRTLGAAVEIAGPGTFRRRTWPPHPGCTCAGQHRRSRAAPRPARPGTGDPRDRHAERMSSNPDGRRAGHLSSNPGDRHAGQVPSNPGDPHAEPAPSNPGDRHAEPAPSNPGDPHAGPAPSNPGDPHAGQVPSDPGDRQKL